MATATVSFRGTGSGNISINISDKRNTFTFRHKFTKLGEHVTILKLNTSAMLKNAQTTKAATVAIEFAEKRDQISQKWEY